MREAYEAELRVALAEGLVSKDEAEALRAEAQGQERSPLLLLVERGRLSEDTLVSLRRELRGAGSPPPEPGSQTHDDDATLTSPQAALPQERRSDTPSFPLRGWDRYLEVRFLGQGGMGRVFLAYDPRLRRNVALKFVRDDDPELVTRFISEARAQARVSHERVCKVYEVGEAQGKTYIAMQYVEGRPLSKLAPELTPEQKAMVLRDAAEGVHEAHRVGLIHRDIKPSNIMVERTEDGSLKPYVMDFGLARDWKEGDTATGSVLGTPYYMAPEQARGEVGGLDRRADVYSLGATLYHVLVGQPPIPGSNALEVLSHIPTEEPRPPRALRPELPADLEAIVLKCLEKDRSARYDSARALAEDLDRFLGGEPVLARPAGLWYRLRKRVRKHRLVVAVASGAFVLVSLALGQAFIARHEVEQRERLARSFTEQVEHIEAIARYSHLAPLHDTRPDRQAIRERMEQLEADIRQAGPLATGPGNYALGQGYLALGDEETALRHLELAWRKGFQEPRAAYALALVMGRLYQRHLQEVERVTSDRAHEDAQALEARKGKLARRYRDPALAYLRRSEGAEVPSTEYVAALIAFYEDRLDDALARLDAHGAGLPWSFEVPKLRGDILRTRATQRSRQGEYQQALADFEAARQAYAMAASIGESEPDVHHALATLEHAAMRMALYGQGEVLPHYTRGLEALSRALTAAPDHYDSRVLEATFHRRLAEQRTIQAGEAEELLGKASAALRLARELNPSRPEARMEQGRNFWQWARYRLERVLDPREQIQQALEALESLGPESRDYDFHTYLGLVFQVWANHADQVGEDSLPHRDRAISAFLQALALDEHPTEAWNNLGIDYLKRAGHARATDSAGDLARAQAAFEKARTLNPKLVPPYLYGARIHEQQAQRLRERGGDPRPELDKALALYRQGLAINPGLFHLPNGVGVLLLTQAREAWGNGGDPFPLLAGAEAALTQANSLAPKQGYSYGNLGEVHFWRATYRHARGEDPRPSLREAVKAYQQSLDRRSGSALAWANLGKVHLALASFELERGRPPRQELERATEALRNALERNPKLADGWLQTAELRALQARWRARQGQARAEDFEEAEQAYRRALELEPKRSEWRIPFGHFHREWAAWLKRTGRDASPSLRRGLELANEALSTRPDWVDARLLKASTLLALAETAVPPEQQQWRHEALEELNRALARNPHLERTWKSQRLLLQRLLGSPPPSSPPKTD